MERTGHRSIDGVRAYKRTCPEQHEKLSHVLQGLSPYKKCKLDDSENTKISKDMTVGSKMEENKENIDQRVICLNLHQNSPHLTSAIATA
jgi:hypothetical protein